MAEKVIGFKIQIEGLAGTIETATQLKRQIAELNAELKKTADVDEIKKLEKKLVDLKAAQSLVNDVTREQVKLRKEEIAGIDKSQGAYRKLSKELNDQRNRYKDLAAAEQESSQEAKDLLISINNLDKKLKGIDATVGQFQRSVGGYTEALGQFFPKLGGTIGGVTGLVGDLSSGFAQLGKTTGVANIGLGAVGIALSAFQGISNILADIKASVKEVTDLKIAFENFGLAGEQLDNVTARAQALGEVFEQDSKQIGIAANTLVKEFGIPVEKAFEIIQTGFLKGADAQGEFLQSLKQYPSQFKRAQIGAEEFLAIAIDSQRQGVFSDKALDAVKEFGIEITKQTTAARDGLVGAFGEEFTSKLFDNLKTGSITGGDALKIVTKEIKNTNLSSVQLQNLLSGLFISAGEDAGNYVLSLGDVLNKTDGLNVAETNLQKQTLQLIKVKEIAALRNTKLAETTREADLESEKFGEGLRDILGQSLNFIIGAFTSTEVSIGKYNDRLAASNELLKENKKISATPNKTKEQIDAEDKLRREKEDKNRKLFEANAKKELILRTQTEAGIEKALDEIKAKRKSIVFGTPEFKKADEEIKRLEKELDKFNPKESGKKGGEKFVKEFTAGSIAALQNKRSELQTAFSNAVVNSESQKQIGVKLNEVNAQIKTAVDTQNEILGKSDEEKKKNAIDNINQNFKVAQSVIELERIKQESSLNEIEDIKEKRFVLNDDYKANIQRLDSLLALEKQGSIEAQNILIERQAAEANYIKSKADLQKQEKQIYDNRIAAEKKFSQTIKQLEIDSIKDETQRQIASLKNKLDNDLENLEKDKDFILLAELEKAKLRKLLIDKTDKEIQAIIDKKEQDDLENEFEKRQKRIELAGQAAMALTDLFSTIQSAKFKKDADLLNQEIQSTEEKIASLEAKAEKASGLKKKRLLKEAADEKVLLEAKNKQAEELQLKAAKAEKKIAIVQSIIQGALAVTRALNSFPFPPLSTGQAIAAGVFAGIQTATIIAQPLAEGGVVTGQRVNQKQNIPTRSNGDNVLAYVKRGEVVLNQRQQSLLGGSPTFRRIGIKGFAEGGIVPPISAPLSAISSDNGMSKYLQVIEAKTDAINNRIDRLQAYVVSDDIARDLAEGNKLKVKATL